jgi:DNA-binding GntR family transcriptional regulator
MSENRLAVLLPIQPLSRETAQDKVYAQLRDLILDGGLPPGQTVTIQGLANSFEVSAMPVREALHRLTAERALAVVSGRSIGIPPLTRQRLADLSRVRIEVEGTAVAWAAGRLTPHDHDRMNVLLQRMSAAETEDGKAYVPANRQFHFLIYAAAGSPTLLGIIEQLWLQVSPYFHLLRDVGNWTEANQAHQALKDACMKGDADAARAALRDDIARAASALENFV